MQFPTVGNLNLDLNHHWQSFVQVIAATLPVLGVWILFWVSAVPPVSNEAHPNLKWVSLCLKVNKDPELHSQIVVKLALLDPTPASPNSPAFNESGCPKRTLVWVFTV